MRLEEGFFEAPAYYGYDIDEKYKTVRERIAAYNALPQALGAIPSLKYYTDRASDMPEAKAQRAAAHGEYRLIQEGSTWILQFRHHEHWQSMYCFDLGVQQQSDHVMGNFWSAHWPQSHFRHHLLMCRHLPDGGKLTLPSLYQLLQQQFGLGVNDVKHGFTEAELAAVMAAFDTHPEAGK